MKRISSLLCLVLATEEDVPEPRQLWGALSSGWAFGKSKAVGQSVDIEREEMRFVNISIAVAGRASSLNSFPCRKKDTGIS